MFASSRRKLSKNLFKMKFMKRSKEKVEKESLEEERKALFQHEVTENMRKAGSKYVIESSFIACENLRYGRMSFGGFNPEIEKIMKESKLETKSDAPPENEGIPDKEFAERYSTIAGSIAKKFSKKRSRSEIKEEPISKKQKIPPSNDDEKKPESSKQTSKNKQKPENEDSLKTLYPKRKRAAEFWKPDN